MESDRQSAKRLFFLSQDKAIISRLTAVELTAIVIILIGQFIVYFNTQLKPYPDVWFHIMQKCNDVSHLFAKNH